LVVRITNKQIICQIVYSKIQGDYVLTQATSKELHRYGIEHGLTNWAAAYATGLLVARRALQKLGLDEKYEGFAEPTGELQLVQPLGDDEPRPFKCYLDVGLRRTSTGSRIFGAMKGASDGGIFIPHNEKRFPGYDPETKSLDAEVLQKYINGGHVAEYMESLEEEDDERFKKQFASYLAADISSADIEELYTSAYEKIREDPSHKPSEKDVALWKKESKGKKAAKLTREQRKERIQAKLDAYKAGKLAVEEEDEEEEADEEEAEDEDDE